MWKNRLRQIKGRKEDLFEQRKKMGIYEGQIDESNEKKKEERCRSWQEKMKKHKREDSKKRGNNRVKMNEERMKRRWEEAKK